MSLKYFVRKFFFIVLLLGTISKVGAQVDFDTKKVIDNVMLYQDSEQKFIFYYAPYGLQLVKNNEGKPNFKFVQMRYTGTKLTNNQGSFSFNSLLRFRVANQVPSKIKRDSIKKILKNAGFSVRKIKPLPIQNLKATLIYAAENDSIFKEFNDGFFENTENTKSSIFWTERDFTLRLNNTDAQLFWTTFQGNQPTLSVNYTYSSKGLNSMNDELTVSGIEDLTEEMKVHMEQEADSINKILKEKVVVSGALSINVDLQIWPDLVTQIDINERIPPEYAALDVYCFDFNNELNENLYAKKLEIKATGVGGDTVSVKITFKATTPDVYAQTIKFKHAVKLDNPYVYRVTNIFNDGVFEKTAWKTVENWHQILDITSQILKNNIDR